MDVYPHTLSLSTQYVNQYGTYKKIALVIGVMLGSISVSVAATLTPTYGGAGGNAFADAIANTNPLTSVTVRAGACLDSIQGITQTGALPAHGGGGGAATTVTWPATEYLVKVYGTYGSYISNISFVTNTGRVMGPYGGACTGGANAFSFIAPTGSKILGFTGRSGSLVDALGVVYSDNLTANLITNPSFESPANGFWAQFATIPGWTGKGDKIELGTSRDFGVTGVTGLEVVELDANFTFSNGTGLYQDVVTQAQQSYTLSVDVAARALTFLGTNSVEVWWRNQYVATVNPTSTALKTYTFNVVGSGGSDRLEFREQVGDNDGVGGIIDNVKLIPVVTVPVTTPAADLTVSSVQPVPALTQLVLSELPVTITNNGTLAAAAPIILTMPLPAGVVAPLKFSRNADAWVCLNPAGTIRCTYNKPLPAGASTTVRLPVKPSANTAGSGISAFSTTVAPAVGETNTANNTSLLLPVGTVITSTAGTIADPSYSTPILDSTLIPKYALPLPNAFASFFKHTPNTTSIPGTDVYNLTVKQINTQILPPGFPSTAVYTYGDPTRPDTFSYPAHTIAANSTAVGLNSLGLGKPVKVKFTDSRDPLAKHLLPIDHSIHGAMAGEPDIRSIAHLHGIKKVNQSSDGYPEGWYSPTGQTGNQFTMTSPTVGYNANPNDYGNDQESTLLWYHDHTLGMTRLNSYAGLAGLYQLRDSNEQTMINNNSLPNGAYEIPLVLQDRTFKPDGSLAYPDTAMTAAGTTMGGTANPSMVPEFFGNVMVVNGVAWPFLEVEPRKYRFRVLNGSNSRFYTLKLSNNASFQVIGTEGGFLNAPTTVNTLTMGPAERYDVIVDFSTANGQALTMTNSAGSPFPNGAPVTAGVDDQIMQFRVNQPLSTVANNPLPTTLRATPVPVLTPIATRQVLLAESTDNNGRILPILGTVANGLLGWMDTVTETPVAGSVETWEIFNDTIDAHPIHLHGGHFQVVNRQAYTATVGTNHALTGISYPSAAVAAPAPEMAWKDTVISYPGQVTRIKVKFENTGLFVWHCHIMEHEDHDMMRPMQVQ